MNLTRGVMLDGDSLGSDLDLTGLRASLAHWDWYPSTEHTQTAQRIARAQVVVTNKVVLDAPLLSQAPELKLICVAATGTNNIDLDAAARHGISVCNVQNYSTASVAQHTLMLMLNLATRALDYQRAAGDGRWSQSRFFCLLDFPVMELAGKRLGIVGYGAIGKKVATLARAFDMELLISARPGQASGNGRLALEEMLAQVDFVSLHCPLTLETHQLMNAERLALMKPGAFLINCARGALVDEQALVQALTSGHLGGAGLDGLSQEPPAQDHPLLNQPPLNLIITPHTAWASREARQRLVDQISEQIRAFTERR